MTPSGISLLYCRLPREDTLQEQFVVLEVLAVRPSRRKALQSVVAQESPERNSNPAPVPGKGLKVLVMRPRLPDNCPYDYPVGVGGKEVSCPPFMFRATCKLIYAFGPCSL